MKRKTIAQIKALIADNRLDETTIAQLRLDQRKGVQQLLRTYEKKQAKIKVRQKQFQQLKQFDDQYKQHETTLVAGIDEAGRGPIAGPVVSAAVILPHTFTCIELTYSKQLNENKR